MPLTPEINAISTILLGISVLFVTLSFVVARGADNRQIWHPEIAGAGTKTRT